MKLVWAACAAMALLVGCVETNVVDCGNGVFCPAGRVCLHIDDPATDMCVDQAVLDACIGLTDGMTCDLAGAPPSACFGGACLPIACGNGRIEPGEICDDGNTVTGDGTCSADCQSNEACGNGEVDPLVLVNGVRVLNEQCDDGNLVSADGCSSTCAFETARWAQLGRPIPPSAGPAMAYDAARHRMVLFSGRLNNLEQYLDGTFEWDGQQWAQIPTLTAPQPREDMGMAYDAARHRIVMFGGHAGDDDAPFSDTWTFDGERWERMVPATSPPGRSNFGMVYDSARKRVVIFGGYSRGAFYDDTWMWDGTNWTELQTTTRPQQRVAFAMAYDPKRNVIVVAGGKKDSSTDGRDTWELSGSTWTQKLDAANTPDQLDVGAKMAYDILNDRMIAFGGHSASGGGTVDTTVAYKNGTWSLPFDNTPGIREGYAMASDPNTATIVMYGGEGAGGVELGTTYVYNGAWVAPTTATAAPKVTGGATGFDPQHGRAWTFGGTDVTGVESDLLYSFNGFRWQQHSWSGAGPAKRLGHGAAYDRARNELVVFGGSDESNALISNETWRYNGTAWSGAVMSPTPTARFGPAMTYDPRRKVTVLFGGATNIGGGFTPNDETWEWNGTAWKLVTTTTSPGTRAVSTMAYDESRGLVVMYGGLRPDGTGFPHELADVWTYDGTDWRQVEDNAPVSERFVHPMAYDNASRDMTLFGGRTLGGSYLADTWSWNGTNWFDTLGPHPSGTGQQLVFSMPGEPGIVVASGEFDTSAGALSDEVWRFAYSNSQAREICDITVDNDGDGLSGCADPDCWSRCTPDCPPGSTCDMSAPRCGDGTCNTAVENCRICAQDCMCQAACGDTFCEAGETLATCPGDCTP